MMEGPPMKLMIDPNAEPIAHHSPIPIPIHWQEEVKAGLDRDVRLVVIEQVPIGEPVTWCHRMVICAKKNEKSHRTIDFQPLNTHATREIHHMQSPFHQYISVPSNTKKTIFDASNGYHSVPFAKRIVTSSLHGADTGTALPQRDTLPPGMDTPDGMMKLYPPFPRKHSDTLLWADNLLESFHQATHWLDICGRHGITLNPDKFRFAMDTVEFAGFEITPSSVCPCRKYLQTIEEFPTPKNITDIRSWFGLVNQVSYTFSMTNKMLPFRELLKPSTPFHWDDYLNTLFEDSKKSDLRRNFRRGLHLRQEEINMPYNRLVKDRHWLLALPEALQMSSGQPHVAGQGWKTTLVGSRFTHPAESRYAPIEGEALVVANALD